MTFASDNTCANTRAILQIAFLEGALHAPLAPNAFVIMRELGCCAAISTTLTTPRHGRKPGHARLPAVRTSPAPVQSARAPRVGARPVYGVAINFSRSRMGHLGAALSHVQDRLLGPCLHRCTRRTVQLSTGKPPATRELGQME